MILHLAFACHSVSFGLDLHRTSISIGAHGLGLRMGWIGYFTWASTA